MAFEGLMKSLVENAGWHLSLDRRTPFLVVTNSKQYHDAYPQFSRSDYPYRSTIIKKGGLWEVVEVAEQKQDEEEILECDGEITTVTAFFHRDMETVNDLGVISTGSDDPFMRPAPMTPKEKAPDRRAES